MIVLQCVNVTKAFGAEPVLERVKLEVSSKDRVSLVGRNGAGKSTLLKIIAGELSHDSGEIMLPKDVEFGYLAQHTGLDSKRSIWEEMLHVFDHLRGMEKTLRSLEEQMSDPLVLADHTRYEKLLSEYDLLQVAFKDQGGYQYEADIRSVLAGLHFQDFDYTTTIDSLSGGQKTRLALAKLLLSKPDLLILDEPTNHLDMATLSWLEQYLSGYPGALLIVSHDRYFLDKLATSVVELSRQRTIRFPGNYSAYLDEKARRYEQDMKLYEKQQEEITKLETFVAKNIVRASTTKRAQSKRKQLEKIDRLTRPDAEEKSASFSFDIKKQTGHEVLRASDLSVAFSDVPVFSHLNLALTRGESVAMIGENGAGKSTLLKAIAKQLTPASGEIFLGSNVTVGYYDQEQAKLTSKKTVLHELWDEHSSIAEKDIRSVLGQFLFSGDDVFKPVTALSGGEKARLALAKLMLEKANLLILDEPTNHLDLDAKEILEAALIDYPGTILFVSHDRYFVNRIASRVIEMAAGEATTYLGDYDYYVEKKAEMAERAALVEEETVPTESKSEKTSFQEDKETKRLQRQKQRRIASIEEEMESLEKAIVESETALTHPDIYSDHVRAAELQKEIHAQNEALEALMEEWEELQQ
ncbi:ABC-F family ATP-binding cassette domain-containing protein [Shouchella shacheensis]|uniref:ABC-F family ATP-binding cassette domain-containing protein n=1 Tax=Shouchella shacheensis TaxID=1649580 RepID=UPI0007400713|nr:ABC-F family ATP-binding cassette domain-containing protein [Shouchella shacheensis]